MRYTDFMFTHTFHLKKCDFRIIYNFFFWNKGKFLRHNEWDIYSCIQNKTSLNVLYRWTLENATRIVYSFPQKYIPIAVNHLWHYFVIHLKTMHENCLVDCKCLICRKSFNCADFFNAKDCHSLFINSFLNFIYGTCLNKAKLWIMHVKLDFDPSKSTWKRFIIRECISFTLAIISGSFSNVTSRCEMERFKFL